MTAETPTRIVPVDAIDALHQCRDELQVVWLACQSEALPDHDGSWTPITETIYGIGKRIDAVLATIGEAPKGSVLS